jgi:hypothetical protein
MCEFCQFGLPLEVANIYEEAVKKLGGKTDVLDYGAGNLVWADYNLDAATACLENFEEWSKNTIFDFSQKELDVLRWSLEKMAELGESVFDIMEDAFYDDYNAWITGKHKYKPIKPTRFPK